MSKSSEKYINVNLGAIQVGIDELAHTISCLDDDDIFRLIKHLALDSELILELYHYFDEEQMLISYGRHPGVTRFMGPDGKYYKARKFV